MTPSPDERVQQWNATRMLVARIEQLEQRMDNAELVSTDNADDVQRILNARSRRAARRWTYAAAAGLAAVALLVLFSGASDVVSMFFGMASLLVLQRTSA